jgi:hypothetical protein
MTKDIHDCIWSALCTNEDYILRHLENSKMQDELRLRYLEDFRDNRRAKDWLIDQCIKENG